MSFVDEVAALPVTTGSRTAAWLASRTPQERAAFDARLDMIRSGQGTYADLHGVCANHGLVITKKSFREYCQQHVSGQLA